MSEFNRWAKDYSKIQPGRWDCKAARLAWQEAERRTVKMLQEWKRHHAIMSDPKSLHYSLCIEEILHKLTDRIEESK